MERNENRHFRQNMLALLGAMIWGTAIVAQSVAAQHMSPFTFNTLRASIAVVFLLGVCVLQGLYRRCKGTAVPRSRRDLILGGLSCGTVLTLAGWFQQRGIQTTLPGKAGFLTSLYIILVPLVGIPLGKKVPGSLWIGMPLAVAGMYFLCVTEELTLASGDIYLCLCALCFTAHILVVDYFTEKVDGVELSCAQFFVMAVLSLGGAMTETPPSLEALPIYLGPVLYVGVFSSGVGYTLQILAQRGSNPAVVSLIMSMESVFAVLGGALLLGNRMTGREYLGCGLMLVAVVLAQLPSSPRKRNEAAKT